VRKPYFICLGQEEGPGMHDSVLCLKHPCVVLWLQKWNPSGNNLHTGDEALPRTELPIAREWSGLEKVTWTVCIEGKYHWREFVQMTCPRHPGCTGRI